MGITLVLHQTYYFILFWSIGLTDGAADTECFMNLTKGHISQAELSDVEVEGGANHTTSANRQQPNQALSSTSE